MFHGKHDEILPLFPSVAQDFDPLIKALKDILVGQARTADDCHFLHLNHQDYII